MATFKMIIPTAMTSSSELRDVHVFRMSMPDHECPWGLKAIALMQKQGISFEDHRLTSQEEVNTFKAQHGVATTPQIFNGDERIGVIQSWPPCLEKKLRELSIPTCQW
jgi:glutaredoxin